MEIESDNMEIEVDKKLIAPEIKNGRFNSLVYRYKGLRNDQIIEYGRHYQMLE